MQKPETQSQRLGPTGRPSNHERMNGTQQEISEQASQVNKHKVEVSETAMEMQRLQHEF